MQSPQDIAKALEPLAFAAAKVIAEIASRPFEKETKGDGSPVTEADAAGEKIILAGLSEFFPEIPVVAEEQASEEGLPDRVGNRFFLVDPLDGTKEFVRGGADYTVNIALVEDGEPVAGVVCAPAQRIAWTGWHDRSSGQRGAEKLALSDDFASVTDRQPMQMRHPAAPPTIVASRSHMTAETESFLSRYPDAECVSVGSSLKFCLLAEGSADIYPRFGPTMEWDTGAGHAVLAAAGGKVLTPEGEPFRYAKPDFRNGFFIASHRDASIAI